MLEYSKLKYIYKFLPYEFFSVFKWIYEHMLQLESDDGPRVYIIES